MLTQRDKDFINKAKKNPKIINYLYGEITDYQKVIKLLGLDKKSVVLDVGVGTGKFLTFLIMMAGCKGVGVEPVPERYDKAIKSMKRYNLEDRLELVNDHYPCNLILKPTHVILHACAFGKENAIDVYNALPQGVKILHNSLHIKKYAHPNTIDTYKIRTTYCKNGNHFFIHEK